MFAPTPGALADVGEAEAPRQQAVRFQAAQQGALAWRNNVGATPAKCPDCGTKRQPIRFGLANDSSKLNKVLKSSDLILAIPRTIQPQDVGKRFAQFGSVECKRNGWTYRGTPEEQAQQAWLALVASVGGYATFSTGTIQL